MNWRKCWQAAAVAVVVSTGFGCGPSFLWFLNRGDEKKNAEFPLTARDGKAEVVVAVSVTASGHGVPAGVDLDLASKIGSQLKALSEANKGTPIRVIDQSKINAMVTNNPERWNLGNPGEFAQRCGADYWIDVNLISFSLQDREFGNEICRGSATVEVSVYEAGAAAPKYQYAHPSMATLRSVDVTQKNIYRNEYLGKLATEIAMKHINHKGEQERALKK
jgi:hypothetical protein